MEAWCFGIRELTTILGGVLVVFLLGGVIEHFRSAPRPVLDRFNLDIAPRLAGNRLEKYLKVEVWIRNSGSGSVVVGPQAYLAVEGADGSPPLLVSLQLYSNSASRAPCEVIGGRARTCLLYYSSEPVQSIRSAAPPRSDDVLRNALEERGSLQSGTAIAIPVFDLAGSPLAPLARL